MMRHEALMIGAIVCTADGECYACAEDLLTQLALTFPEHDDVWNQAWASYVEAEPNPYDGPLQFNADGTLVKRGNS